MNQRKFYHENFFLKEKSPNLENLSLEILGYMVVIMQNIQDKADSQKTKVNARKIRKVRADGNNFVLGKNGGQTPSCRLIVVVRQAGQNACSLQFFEIRQLILKHV